MSTQGSSMPYRYAHPQDPRMPVTYPVASTSTASAYAYAQQQQQLANRQTQSQSSSASTSYTPFIPPPVQKQPVPQPKRPSPLSDRPHSIEELARIAGQDKYDRYGDIKQDLRYAEVYLAEGKKDLAADDLEWAFIHFARTATLILQRMPTNSHYNEMKAAHRETLADNGNFCLERMSEIKPKLVDRYEVWRQRNPNAKVELDMHRMLSAMAVRDNEELAIRAQASKMKRAASKDEAARRARGEDEKARPGELVRQDSYASKEGDRLDPTRQQQVYDTAARKAYDDARRRQEEVRREAEESRRREVEYDAAAKKAYEDARRRQEEARREAEESRRREEERAKAVDIERRRKEAEEEGRRREAEIAKRKYEEAQRQGQEAVARRKLEEMEYRRQREEAKRRDIEETTRREQEGIAERQRQADAEARASRGVVLQLPMPVPIPGPPPSSSSSSDSSSAAPTLTPRQQDGLPVLPLESPTREENVDPSSGRHHPQPVHAMPDRATGRTKAFDDPITTTSPPPKDNRAADWLRMTDDQRTQGYTPSLQSMFTTSISGPPTGLLFSPNHPEGPSMRNMPTSPDRPPAHIRHMWEKAGYGYSLPEPPKPKPIQYNSRILRPEQVREREETIFPTDLKIVHVPQDVLPRFLDVAAVNTARNKETCALLMGRLDKKEYRVVTLLIPKQRATSDTCTMEEEELISEFTEKRKMMTLGWIHTHPTQSCFMSSLDLHTHAGYQSMLPEFFAIVCAPKQVPNCGIFRLTDPPGLKTILKCEKKAAFHPHPELPIYTDADKGHVVWTKAAPLEIVDLR